MTAFSPCRKAIENVTGGGGEARIGERGISGLESGGEGTAIERNYPS